MKIEQGMTPLEIRSSLSLASIYGLRMLGMFLILPIFAIYAEGLPGSPLGFSGRSCPRGLWFNPSSLSIALRYAV